jgi:hypothetical protein
VRAITLIWQGYPAGNRLALAWQLTPAHRARLYSSGAR